jgi:hypothetical protein
MYVRETYPRPRAGQITASKVDPGSNNETKDVERVPSVSLSGSVSRMCDLLDDYQRSHKECSESETDDDSTNNEDCLSELLLDACGCTDEHNR